MLKYKDTITIKRVDKQGVISIIHTDIEADIQKKQRGGFSNISDNSEKGDYFVAVKILQNTIKTGDIIFEENRKFKILRSDLIDFEESENFVELDCLLI